MIVMTAQQLVDRVKLIANTNTTYKLGTFGNKIINGRTAWDCSGLLKGILWGYPDSGKYQSNDVHDQNADTIISKCNNVSTDFSNLLLGEIVWMKGHMGIYVGNGKVIEATPKWDNGVQVTTCGNVVNGSKSRKWLKHGKSPHIDYGVLDKVSKPIVSNSWIARLQQECNNQGYSSQTVDGIAGNKTLAGCPLLGTKSRGKITALLQEYLNGLGYDCGKIDGINGKNTQKAIKKFQQDNGLRADGIVGLKTWKAILNL